MHNIRRALVTGITGAGGSYLGEALTRHGAEVHGFTRWHSRGDPCVPDGAILHEVDLTDLSSVIRGLEKADANSIFHMASHANVRACFDTPLSVLQNNIMGTANLLEGIRIVYGERPVGFRFLMCSSSEVYGQVKPDEVPIRETNEMRPASPYAVSKLAQDALSHAYWLNYGIEVVRTRMFAYFNPRRADIFSTSFARQVVEIERGERSLLKHGNLASVRTMIDIRDAMSAYIAAMELCEPGEAYNIGGDATLTVGDFLRLLRVGAKRDIPIMQDEALMRPTDVTLQIPDCAKFKAATGWEPRFSLEDSVEHLLGELRGPVAVTDAYLGEPEYAAALSRA